MSDYGFIQNPPTPGHPYAEDRVLKGLLARFLPADILFEAERELEGLGRILLEEFYPQQLMERSIEPRHQPWDAWGNRVDRIELTPLWEKAKPVAATFGLVADAYEGQRQPHGRLIQFAKAYLFHPATDVFCCPLAMTDGATAALLRASPDATITRAITHLTSRDPKLFWTSGQWMTETSGGSDIGATETIARRDGHRWRLSGRKWFTSACTSEVALALARPENAPPGSRGLALFCLDTGGGGQLHPGIRITRLKDKLGTRKLPTAELLLDSVPAHLVGGTGNGVKAISPMLNVTRTWNSVCAIATLRRGIALARDYAFKRVAFGRPLADQPLHAYTLAGVQARFEGAFALTFQVVRMLGAADCNQLGKREQTVLRILTPIAKLHTAKTAVAGISELLESFGGAGYMEDTGLPGLLRDAQVLPIWEGTTNVLSLDTLRAAGSDLSGIDAVIDWLRNKLSDGDTGSAAQARKAADHMASQLKDEMMELRDANDADVIEANGRRIAMRLGDLASLVLLIDQARWEFQRSRDSRAQLAANRLAEETAAPLARANLDDDRALATDIYV